MPALVRRVAPRIPERHRGVLSADDVVQETLTDAFLDHAGFSGDEDGFRAWLHTLAEHNLVDALRGLDAARRGGGGAPRSVDDASWETFFHDLTGRTQTSPSVGAARRETADRMRALVDRLPPDHRAVVLGYDLEGRSIDEVATSLGRSVGACYLLRNRALKRLEKLA